ncbi:MAG TPA: AarF/UbiB family protein, partial [Myxococcaceae bacterium]
LVMQWVEGVPLYKWSEKHGLTLRQVIWQLAQAARALEATHEHGVHRDVKGDNVLVDDDGRVVLLDFGSCWYPGAPPLTAGVPPGTEQYRSPQQVFFRFALGMGAGHYYVAPPYDDVYALGVTAYRLLASTYPPSSADLAADETARLVPPRGVAEVCPELSALVMRMLSEEPEARGTARQVAEALERLLRQANPFLDAIWIESSAAEPTQKTVPSEPEPDLEPEPVPAPAPSAQEGLSPRFGCLTAFIVLGTLVIVLTRDVNRRGVAYTEAPRTTPQGTGNPDGGTGGMGDEAMASVSPAGTPPSSGSGFTRQVLDGPLPGQKLPPCNKRGAVVIKGGCWVVIEGSGKPPCGPGDYEHEDRCYFPLLINAERVPTSDDPP